MKQQQHPVPYDLLAHFSAYWLRLKEQLTSPWTKLVLLSALYLLFARQDLNFSISINGASMLGFSEASVIYDLPEGQSESNARNVSQLVSHSPVERAPSERVWTAKEKRQLAYVAEYAETAREEMRKSKVPASITLAQALLESNIGSSTLATKNNNHFGIKCFSRSCKKGHCSNFSDDSHKDFFRIYSSARESFLAHSQLLKKDRYAGLFRLAITDYRGWAKGLSKAGYATDPRYADKLIRLIENLGLQVYDK